jgi:hypothetical protein
VEENLFLAPGEASSLDAEETETNGRSNGTEDSPIPEAIRLIRDRNTA